MSGMQEKDPKKEIEESINKALESGVGPKVARFALACLSAVPGAGGAIGGLAGVWSEKEQDNFNKVFTAWLKLQQDEIKEIGQTIVEVMLRVDQTDQRVMQRIESLEYLKIVKKCFRDWSAAESEEKRVLIRNLLANSAGTQICSDDVIRMFVNWISIYSEAHFAVIREVYEKPGSTRGDVWQEIHGGDVREDSAEADLFKLLFHDLSVGHVIRQHREKDYSGNFIKQSNKGPRRTMSHIMISAFDDAKSYELTELGKQFVHYTMNEIVPKIAEKSSDGG